MNPLLQIDSPVAAGRSQAVPASTALISARSLAALVLVLVFWKVSGIRYWPHAYAGVQYVPHRLVYYTEFLVSLLAIFSTMVSVNLLPTSNFKRLWLVPLFVAWAVVGGIFVQLPLIPAFLGVSGYLDAFLALVVSFGVFGRARTLGMLAWVSFLFVILNLASVAVPSVSVMIGDFSGRFRGLTAHRNDLAQLAYTCALIAVAAKGLTPRWLRICTLLGALVLLAAARSVQGVLLLPVGLFIYQFAARIRTLRHPLVVLSVLVLFCLGVFIWEQFGSLDGFLAYFGRDASFSGRDRIWALSLHLLQHMPFMGYGPGQIGTEVLSASLLQRFGLGTLFGSAHSSYLEAFLTYGWLGGGLFMAAVLSGFLEVLRALLRRVDTYAALAFSLLVMALLGGFTASEKLFLPGLGWFTFVLALVLAQQQLPANK